MKASEITDSMRRCQHREPTARPRNYWCVGKTCNEGRQQVATMQVGDLWYCQACGLIERANLIKRAKQQEKSGKPVLAPQSPVTVPLEQKPGKAKAVGLGKPQGRRAMNKTEAAMIPLLEARKQAGEISRYEWEGITLRWPDGMRYTPDFAVWRNGWMKSDGITAHWQDMLFIETKGAFIEGDALVKFRAARAHWPEFLWEMWQRKKGAWEKVL